MPNMSHSSPDGPLGNNVIIGILKECGTIFVAIDCLRAQIPIINFSRTKFGTIIANACVCVCFYAKFV